MGRVLALDIGRKRTGVAVTDPLRIIANGINTIPTHTVIDFLSEYFSKESVDTIVIGYPRQLNNQLSEAVTYIQPVINRIKKVFPNMIV